MIPVATKSTEFDSLPGDEIAFSIGNPAWVMKQLSKLYSNDILATIREYSTNAFDAHVEAGFGTPIKVTLPSTYHPYFEVEDFGIGMSTETLKTVYTSFGDSSKRDSNLYNGMLGFGCKAALAYTDSFTVESVKDGVKTQALIVRKPDWSISMRVVSVVKTEQENGTKVSIPSHSHPAFAQIARDFYRFWKPGTVLVDGKEPEWAVGEKLDDNLFYSKSQGTSYVVMGNVAYRIANPDALFRNRGMNSISFVAYVPNGSVEFTPSREDLEYTDETKKTLHSVIQNFEKKMLAEAKADISSASDYFDAYIKYTYWANKLGKGPFGDLEFKGEKFTDKIDIKGMRYRPSDLRYNTYSFEGWHISTMSETLIVTGMPNNLSSYHKSKAKQMRDIIGIRANYILFIEDDTVDSVWVDSKRVVSWEDVKAATKVARISSGVTRTPRVKGTYDYATKDGCKWEETIPAGKDLFYITVADEKNYHVPQALAAFKSDAVVVTLGANRITKFCRDNPQAKSFTAHFRPLVELNGIKFLDDATKEALAIGHMTREWLRILDVKKINDPEFARIKTLINDSTNVKLSAYNRAYTLASWMQMGYNFKQHNIERDNDSLIEERYPLMNNLSRFNAPKEEIYLYLNARYEYNKTKGI